MALKAKLRMPDRDRMMALNAKLWKDSDSERQTEKRWWLWMPKLRRYGGFRRPNWEGMMALNVKLKRDGGFGGLNWEGMVALNAKLKRDGGFEC